MNLYSKEYMKAMAFESPSYIKRTSTSILSEWVKVFGVRSAIHVKSMAEIDFTKTGMTAILMLGQSGMGKTTISYDILKENPSFSYLSVDDEGMEILHETLSQQVMLPQDIFDSMIRDSLGDKLEKIAEEKRNVIIEGDWVTPESRLVIMRTLRKLGYKTIILFSILGISKWIAKARLKKRAVDLCIRNFLGTQPKNAKEFMDEVEVAKEKYGEPDPQLVNKYYEHLLKYYEEDEPLITSLFLQLDLELFDCGVDYYIDYYSEK